MTPWALLRFIDCETCQRSWRHGWFGAYRCGECGRPSYWPEAGADGTTP